ncbi:methylated-DNA--[protein]-cysteine S-methyltransferase [Erysipelotrichaceae bacterium HCN-30851]
MFYQYLNSPIGFIKITANNEAINEVIFVENEEEDNPNALTQEATNQLMEYFEGKRKVFNLPLSPIGTSFQQAVWEALCSIPYGETRSYGEIAKMIGNPKASRAVGMANNRNPISIIIPCHRVIGASGKLVGYGGGINKKIYLLDLEKAIYKK